MSNKTLLPQIALLQEQINNFEKSGFFTEKEIDSKTFPLRIELASLKMQQSFLEASESMCRFGMSLDSYIEGQKEFNECFSNLKNVSINDIHVVDAQIINANNQEEK